MGAVSKCLNNVVSFLVFSLLDIVDFSLCFVYKALDSLFEAEHKPCYCSAPVSSSGKIMLSEQGGYSKIVSLTRTKIQLDEVSDTLYSRPSTLSGISNLVNLDFVKRVFKIDDYDHNVVKKPVEKTTKKNGWSVFSSTDAEKLQRNPRWSDCHCRSCTSWVSSCKDSLFVKVQEPRGSSNAKEDVLFIHGFLSSSAFWTETLFPNFSDAAKSTYRLFAVDLMGYGKSPKPNDSSYTLREHLDMIEKSVLEQHKIKSFHIVAHSLGCILALALAVKRPGSIKSLTLLAPPYYTVPKGVKPTQYVMRRVAPRLIWPPIVFGASVGSWYEHITRTASVFLCKNHYLLDFLTKIVTGNRIRTYLIEGFFCHTHIASWHTLHNIIFGTGSKLEAYLDFVRDKTSCDVVLFHGVNDDLIPVECSYNLRGKIPRARVRVVENKDHITIVVGRQREFARELEEIWRRSSRQ